MHLDNTRIKLMKNIQLEFTLPLPILHSLYTYRTWQNPASAVREMAWLKMGF
jgi:hypothetical protein